MSFQAIKSNYLDRHRAHLIAVGFLCSRVALAYTNPGAAALLCQDLHQIVRSTFAAESASTR